MRIPEVRLDGFAPAVPLFARGSCGVALARAAATAATTIRACHPSHHAQTVGVRCGAHAHSDVLGDVLSSESALCISG